MALATLSIDIVAKLANLQTSLDKAQHLSARTAADMERRFQSVNAAFGKLGLVLGSAFGATTFTAFIRSTAEGLDKLKDLSDATGSTVENLSALEDVGLRTGASFDTVAASVVKFNKVLSEAKAGTEDAEIFKKLGLDVAALKQLDPAEALRQTAVALSRFADDGNKARAVQALFGKSVQEVAPFLKDLAEQTKLVGTVTTAQAAEAEKFNQNLLALQKNSLDLARTLSGPLIEGVNQLADRYKNATKEGKGFLTFLIEDFGRAQEQQRGLLRGLLGIAPPAKRSASGEVGYEDFNNARDARMLRGDKLSLGDFGKPDKPKGGGQSEAQKYLENLQRQLEKTRDLTLYEQALLDIQQKRLTGITPLLQQQILAQAKLNDQDKQSKELRTAQVELNTRLGKAASDRIEDLEKGNKTMAEEIELLGLTAYGQSVVEQRRVKAIRSLKEEERARRAANGATDETLQSLDAEIAALKRREELINERGVKQSQLDAKDKAVDEVDDFARRARENIQDQLADTVYDVFRGDFSKIGDNWGQLILRMAAQAQAAQLNKALFGDGKSDNGVLGQLINAGATYLFGGSSGMSTNNTGDSLPTRGGAATGTNFVERDMVTMLHKGEAIVPKKYNPAAGGVGGGYGKVVINNYDAGNNQVQQTERETPDGKVLEIAVKRLARQVVNEEIGRGGSIDRSMRGAYGLSRQTARRS